MSYLHMHHIFILVVVYFISFPSQSGNYMVWVNHLKELELQPFTLSWLSWWPDSSVTLVVSNEHSTSRLLDQSQSFIHSLSLLLLVTRPNSNKQINKSTIEY